MKSGATDHYRPDIVLFVNGIPLSIIECKRPDIKDSLRQAIAQHIRNQQEDGIRQLYIYSQLNTSIATDSAMYGTAGTPEQFWGHWTEKFASAEEEMNHKSHLTALKNEPLTPQQKDRLFGDRFKYVRAYFEALESKTIIPAVQDGYLMNVYTPKRFLDLIFGFIVYDNNVKKVARYQQYFAIKKTIERISSID
jgi:type I restriction enzyme, R subunit